MKLSPELVLCVAGSQWQGQTPTPHQIIKALDCGGYKVVEHDMMVHTGRRYEEIDPVAIINDICERRGITPTELARSVGLAPSSINRNVYKNGGYTGTMGVRTLNKIIAWDNSRP